MITINMHKPIRAIVVEHDAGEFHQPFSALRVSDKDGNTVTLFLPAATGAAVSAAINAAIGGSE